MKTKIISQIFYITTYSPTYKRILKELNEVPALFITRPYFSDFHGIEFVVNVPTGKGSGAKIKKIHEILGT